jgi:hypothetical protein
VVSQAWKKLVNITEFAKAHRLKPAREDDMVIVGKAGQIYEYSDALLGVMFITPAKKAPRPRVWNNLSAQCVLAGMTLRQDGDAEGALSFDPANPAHVTLALKLAGVKRKRQLTPEQLVRLASVGFKASKTTQQGSLET